MLSARHRAELALVLVALLWGITFPLIRSALQSLEPAQFVGWRFLMAVLAFLPLVLLHPEARAALGKALLPGVLLGLLAWASYFTQTIGLQTVPAGRAAFITGLNVVFVPMLAPLFRAGRPSRVDVLAAILATAGLYLMTAGVGLRWGFSRGDSWILLCALSYAVYILVLQRVLLRRPQEVALAFTQVLGIASYGWIALALDGSIAIEWSRSVVIALLVCAILATVGTFWLQTRYQGRTSPQRVALIFSLEPVFAALFAWWLLAETLSGRAVLGALLILLAVLGAEWWGRPGPTPSEKTSAGFRPS